MTAPPEPPDFVPPPRWSARTLVLAWIVPSVLGIPFAVVTLPAGETRVTLWRVLLVVLATWQVWALITLPVLALADRVPLQRPWRARAVVLHAAASLLACAVQALATTAAARWLLPDTGATFAGVFAFWLMLLTPAGVIVYAAVVAARTSQVHRARAAARDAQARELAARLTEAQLQSLRAQLRPHFLFNTLNAVVALVRDGERARAEDALLGLGALLRATLHGDARHEITLEQEAEFVEQYLAIERLRMGERLRAEVDVPAALRDARVPSLCLQPFVENALRHGLRHVAGEAVVRVSARAEDGRLVLRVADNGVGLPPGFDVETTSGIGVSNARARLRQLHGAAASVTLTSPTPGRGTTAELTLPLAHAPVGAAR